MGRLGARIRSDPRGAQNETLRIFVAKNKKVITLVESWLNDKSGYDQRVWPKLSRAIEVNRLSNRKRLKEDDSRRSTK